MLTRLWLILLLLAPGFSPAWVLTSVQPVINESMTGCGMIDDAFGCCCCAPAECPCIVNDETPSPEPIEPATPPRSARDHFTPSAVPTAMLPIDEATASTHAWCDSFYQQRHLPVRSVHIQVCLWTT